MRSHHIETEDLKWVAINFHKIVRNSTPAPAPVEKRPWWSFFACADQTGKVQPSHGNRIKPR